MQRQSQDPDLYRATPFKYPETEPAGSIKVIAPKVVSVGRPVKSDSIKIIEIPRVPAWMASMGAIKSTPAKS